MPFHSSLGIVRRAAGTPRARPPHIDYNQRTFNSRRLARGQVRVVASTDDPILKQAVKEPVAFWGGFVAGSLGLNLEEDPLKTWVNRTASEAQGVPAPLEPASQDARTTSRQDARMRLQQALAEDRKPNNGISR